MQLVYLNSRINRKRSSARLKSLYMIMERIDFEEQLKR